VDNYSGTSEKGVAPSQDHQENVEGGRRPWTRFLLAKIIVIMVISVYVLVSVYYIFPDETILDERDVSGNNTFEFEVDSDHLEVYVGSRRAPDDPVIGYELTSDASGEVVANGTLEVRSLFAHLAGTPNLEVKVVEHGQYSLDTVDLADEPEDDFSIYIVQRTISPAYDRFFVHYSFALFIFVIISYIYRPRGGWDNSSERYWYREETVALLARGLGFMLILWALFLLGP
jgi:hypothetical protein